jgi:copper transport protein
MPVMGVSILVLAAVSPPAASWPPWWRVLSTFAYFLGLALVLGGTLTYLVVTRAGLRTSDVDDADAGVIRLRSATLLAWSGPVLVVAAYLQLTGRVARADPGTSFGQALVPARIWQFLIQPAKPGSWVSSGTLILTQNILFVVVAALLASLFIPAAHGHLDRVASTAAPIAVVALVVNSLPTSLDGQTFDDALNLVLTETHIVAGCTYVGGLACLVLLSRARRTLGQRAALWWTRIWQRFSILALVTVAAVIISGCWLAWKHVGGPAELVTTVYGRFLLVKLLLVLTLILTGAYNEFVLTPRVARAHATGDIGEGFALTLGRFPAVVTAEAALGVGVLLIVPFLAGSARAQAGTGAAPTVDGTILALGLVLVASLATSLYAAHRVSLLLTRRAEASGRLARSPAATERDVLSVTADTATRSSTSSPTRAGAKRLHRGP